MNFKHPLNIGIIWGVVIGLSLAMAHNVWADKEMASALPLEDLRTFTDVYARIKQDYVTDVDDSDLLKNAIRGMLAGLDPHSSYLDEEQFRELQIGTSGEFGGLGIEVGMENGFVKVIAPIDDTPADRAGVKAGDLIIKLDDKSVKGLTLEEAVKLMRGKKGSDIVLTIVREGEDAPLDLTLTRDVIRVRSVRNRVLEPGYGYVRISNFQSKTTRGLLDALDSLKKKNEGDLKGLVLDLRNNPGGVLTGAVGVSDVFLKDNQLIVYTEGRVEDSELKYSASTGDSLAGAPLVVLINQGSASASEIVAGAMQDHERATILGTTSFGKGSVQTILPLNDSTALKLTTARYYTPQGRSIQSEGIVPDILLKIEGASDEESTALSIISEADLEGHLENENQEVNKKAREPKSIVTVPKQTKDDATDYALEEALKLLKSMSGTQQAKL
ncbi:MAG: S41 family peptidase [Gammaproteobacteria bacterium]|nr:S41 family peptidase [Gammaproteobacteria bacterium]